jgi:hypothetical protein
MGILLGVAGLLWLVPAFPMPEGPPWTPVGEEAAAALALRPGSLTAPEFDYLVRNAPDRLRVLAVGGTGAFPADNLPGVEVIPMEPESVFAPFARVCRDGARVVFVDRDGREGGAVLGGLLYRLNGCEAMWLGQGLDGYVAWLEGQGRTAVLRPSVRPPGLALPPLPAEPPSEAGRSAR